MIDNGIVVLCKSNIPTGYLAHESGNNVWGLALNPWNKIRSTGGSSGGEGGLVGSYCSPMGLGTDVGGSIRVPAAWCGIYGFKPTPKRSSIREILTADNSFWLGFKQCEVMGGPMARCVEDLKMFHEVCFGNLWNYDPWSTKIPFDKKLYNDTLNSKKLKIAYLEMDLDNGCAQSL